MKEPIKVRSEHMSLSAFQIMSNIAMALLPALAMISASFATAQMPDWSSVGYVAGGSVVSAVMNTIRQLFTNGSGELQISKK